MNTHEITSKCILCGSEKASLIFSVLRKRSECKLCSGSLSSNYQVKTSNKRGKREIALISQNGTIITNDELTGNSPWFGVFSGDDFLDVTVGSNGIRIRSKKFRIDFYFDETMNVRHLFSRNKKASW